MAVNKITFNKDVKFNCDVEFLGDVEGIIGVVDPKECLFTNDTYYMNKVYFDFNDLNLFNITLSNHYSSGTPAVALVVNGKNYFLDSLELNATELPQIYIGSILTTKQLPPRCSLASLVSSGIYDIRATDTTKINTKVEYINNKTFDKQIPIIVDTSTAVLYDNDDPEYPTQLGTINISGRNTYVYATVNILTGATFTFNLTVTAYDMNGDQLEGTSGSYEDFTFTKTFSTYDSIFKVVSTPCKS